MAPIPAPSAAAGTLVAPPAFQPLYASCRLGPPLESIFGRPTQTQHQPSSAHPLWTTLTASMESFPRSTATATAVPVTPHSDILSEISASIHFSQVQFASGPGLTLATAPAIQVPPLDTSTTPTAHFSTLSTNMGSSPRCTFSSASKPVWLGPISRPFATSVPALDNDEDGLYGQPDTSEGLHLNDQSEIPLSPSGEHSPASHLSNSNSLSAPQASQTVSQENVRPLAGSVTALPLGSPTSSTSPTSSQPTSSTSPTSSQPTSSTSPTLSQPTSATVTNPSATASVTPASNKGNENVKKIVPGVCGAALVILAVGSYIAWLLHQDKKKKKAQEIEQAAPELVPGDSVSQRRLSITTWDTSCSEYSSDYESPMSSEWMG